MSLKKFQEVKEQKNDIENLLSWAPYMKNNRCGLGQTAMNPTITTIKNFRYLYDKLTEGNSDLINPDFDESEALKDYEAVISKNK